MKVNNPNEKYYPKPNSKLFKSTNKEELESKIYYAYLDSVECINRKFHIRFDCIIKNIADNVTINKETILEFPSIVIDIIGDENEIRNKFSYRNLHLLESSWMLLQTSIKDTQIYQEQYYNFERVGNDQTIRSYDIESITRYRFMDDASKIKVVEIRNATTLEENPEIEIKDFLNSLDLKDFSHVNIYNVGQGNCIGLVDNKNKPLLYNDVGGGSGANKKTYPKLFKLCTDNNPPVILSHWDLDHIQTAVFNDEILNSKWLVPKQLSLSNTAIHVALELKKRGNLICWNDTITNINFNGHIISKCSGNPHNKNNSGLALFVNYGKNKFVLLPGDANYTKIFYNPTNELLGLVASHHGSKGAIAGLPDPIDENSMLVFSYGYANTYGHPTARNSYTRANWINSKDTTIGNIGMIKNPIYLKSSCTTSVALNIKEHF